MTMFRCIKLVVLEPGEILRLTAPTLLPLLHLPTCPIIVVSISLTYDLNRHVLYLLF